MQKKKIAAIIGILFTISCCLGMLYVDGYYLPYKICRPMTYPDGKVQPKRDIEWFSYTTNDTLEDVISFYDQYLPLDKRHLMMGVDLGRWSKHKLGDFRYVYSCYGNDINHITGESGCISIEEGKVGTHIKGWLIRSDSSNVPCFGKDDMEKSSGS